MQFDNNGLHLGLLPHLLSLSKLYLLQQVKEVRYDYTECDNQNNLSVTCAAFLEGLQSNNTGQTCPCKITIDLEEDFTVSIGLTWC